jgi:DNA (cytosine-5)-methyltransferase 1
MKKWAYYNDVDPFVCEWVRNLIRAGRITDGEVDERPIQQVSADDLRGFGRVHMFCGIAGWDYALNLAGWGDDRPVWTGSCPCQPFSAAGKQKGEADERHLWPEFRRLIAECAPSVVFGEQVASKLGREWLSGVRADLEALGFAVGAADLCAAGVGAPHIRQRLWWVALAGGEGLEGCSGDAGELRAERQRAAAERGGEAGGLAHSDGGIARHGNLQPGGQHGQQPQDGGTGRMADTVRPGWPEGRAGPRDGSSPWSGGTLIPCADGKARRVGSGVQPLAHGAPARVGRLRGYGNAIVPQVAAEFIRAARETGIG